MAAGVDEAAADEDDAGDLVEPRQLADGVEDDDVGVGRADRPAALVRRTTRKPSSAASRVTSSKRSGWRGATTSSASGQRAWTRWKASNEA